MNWLSFFVCSTWYMSSLPTGWCQSDNQRRGWEKIVTELTTTKSENCEVRDHFSFTFCELNRHAIYYAVRYYTSVHFFSLPHTYTNIVFQLCRFRCAEKITTKSLTDKKPLANCTTFDMLNNRPGRIREKAATTTIFFWPPLIVFMVIIVTRLVRAAFCDQEWLAHVLVV